MFTFIITLTVIVALLLVLVVLAQNSKGGGLSSQFGGSTSQVMGVKRTGDLLEKMTWGLAIALIVLSLSSYVFLPTEVKNPNAGSSILEKAEEQTILPPATNDIPLEGLEPDSTGQ